jgi:TPP-dependent indolepyruvate ferredoxin oxidoreductase alpha subunit
LVDVLIFLTYFLLPVSRRTAKQRKERKEVGLIIASAGCPQSRGETAVSFTVASKRVFVVRDGRLCVLCVLCVSFFRSSSLSASSTRPRHTDSSTPRAASPVAARIAST